MEKEIYKDIPGYEGLYQVSNFGNVISFINNHGNLYKIPKQKKIGINNYGYFYTNLSKNKKHRPWPIHQLVAMAFLGHQPNGYEKVVNHIDRNKLNNNVDNIELVTARYNTTEYKKDVGVHWDKQMKKWRSAIYINKHIFLGLFDNKEDGLNFYQKALTNIHLYDGDNKKFKNLIQTKCQR
mgnify:CR=1 FL=1